MTDYLRRMPWWVRAVFVLWLAVAVAEATHGEWERVAVVLLITLAGATVEGFVQAASDSEARYIVAASLLEATELELERVSRKRDELQVEVVDYRLRLAIDGREWRPGETCTVCGGVHR